MSFYVFTADHSGLPLALRLKDEGENVALAMIHPNQRNGKLETPKTPDEKKQAAEKVAA